MSIAGHYWTVAPRFQPLPPAPPSRPWETTVHDPEIGPVRLTGRFTEHPGARSAVVLLHGISGNADSRYARLGAASALAAGMSCLRFNMRGSDRLGEDYYHAGLTADLPAALDSRELAACERVHLLGYSLGGHVALRFAAECGAGRHPRAAARLGAVAAVCSPLDLKAGQLAIDRPVAALYRRYAFRGLKEIFAAVAERRPVPLPAAEARRIVRLWDWDERVVAPRWGFAGADDYYARASVAPLLPRLAVPALLVAAADDPMVPASVLRPVLAAVTAPALTVRWLAGAGHLGFPPGLSLDGRRSGRKRARVGEAGWSEAEEADLDAQIVAWLAGAAERGLAPAAEGAADKG